MFTRGVFPILAAVLVALLFAPSAGRAADARGDAAELSAALMSPFCPGLLLTNCPSANAQALRREIEERFAQGESRDAIEEDLVSRYGEAIRGAPRARGLGMVAWVLPAIAGGMTLAFAIIAVRRAVIRRPASTSHSADDPALAARLDEALHDLD